MAAEVEAKRQPADPKWREHRWQTFHETREEYIRHLVQNISDCKAMIKRWDEVALKVPDISSEIVSTIEAEKESLADYQTELRKVLS